LMKSHNLPKLHDTTADRRLRLFGDALLPVLKRLCHGNQPSVIDDSELELGRLNVSSLS